MNIKFALVAFAVVLGSTLLVTPSQAGMNSNGGPSPVFISDTLTPLETPGPCGNGEKVVGRITAIDSDENTLKLEVHQLSLNKGDPDRVDTITVAVTPQSHLMRNRKSLPLTSVSVFTVGSTIGVMGGVLRDGRMEARCIGEDVVRMTRKKRAN